METYREILREKILEKKAINKSYGIRYMAKKLDISPSHLSMTLNGKRDISRQMAMKITRELNMPNQERDKFLDLVELETCRDQETRDEILEKIAVNHRDEHIQLSVDQFKVISTWYHFPIIELVRVYTNKVNPKFIAKKLGVEELEAANALTRLQRLGYIVIEEGSYKALNLHFKISSHVANEHIQNFHAQMCDQAKKSITNDIESRDLNSITLSLNNDEREQLKLMIKDFKEKVKSKIDNKRKNKKVYQMNIQMFCLEKENES